MYNRFLNRLAIKSKVWQKLLDTSVRQKREISSLRAEVGKLLEFKLAVERAHAAYMRAKLAEVPDA